MNVGGARLALRERTPVDALDAGARFVAAHASVYARLAFVVLVPSFLLTLLASRLGWLAGWLVALPLVFVADAAFVALAGQLVFDPGASARSALGAVGERAGALAGLFAGTTLLLVVGSACFVLPGVFVLATAFFATQSVLLERSSLGEAMRRASRLFSSSSDGPVGLVVLGAGAVGSVLVGDVTGRTVAEGLLLVSLGPPLLQTGGSAFAAAGLFASVPFVATLRLVLYLNARTRLEGWDVQAKVAAAVARSARGGALGLVLVLLGALATPTTAHAAETSPERATSVLAEARRDPRYVFCSAPRRPLSPAARDACPAARQGEIPDCEGLVRACDALEHEAPEVGWLAQIVPALLVVAQGAVWVLLALVALAVLVPVVLGVRALLRRRRADGAAEPAPEPEAPSEAPTVRLAGARLLLSEADAALAAGALGRAGSLYLAAALAGLEERGLLQREPQRTNGEYLRRAPDDARADLAALVHAVDATEFGGAAPEAARVAALGGVARRLVGLTTLALALLGLAGCDRVGRGAAALGQQVDDPGGGELLHDVLARLGHAPRPLPRALAALDPPAEGAPPRVLVLDAARVDVDDAVQERLVAFVRGGGVLVLAGDPARWPRAFEARVDPRRTFESAHVLARLPFEATHDGARADGPDDDDDDGDGDGDPNGGGPPPAPEDLPLDARLDDALVQRSPALELPAPGVPIAWAETGGHVAAGYRLLGDGAVVLVPASDVLSNAGLSRGRSVVGVAALVAHAGTLARLAAADRGAPTDAPVELYLARPEDAFDPPGDPLSALVRAGLGLALLQAAVAVLCLYVARGARHAAPRRAHAPGRTAFAEHVEATGAFYATRRADRHALRVYARWLERDALGDVRGRLRGGGSPAELAERSGEAPDALREALAHAQALGPAPKLDGDELARLRTLVDVAARALAVGGSGATPITPTVPPPPPPARPQDPA